MNTKPTQKNVPVGWQLLKAGQFVLDQKGAVKIGPFGSSLKKEYLTKSGYKVYGQDNVIGKNFALGDRYINDERFQTLRTCSVEPGDFVVSMMGTIGASAIVPEGIESGIMDSHLLRIKVDNKKVSKEFLSYQFQSEVIQKQIKALSVGGIMAGLSSGVINKLLFFIPYTFEQNRIVAVLETWDKTIESLKKKIDAKRNIKKGLMQALLSGKTRIGNSSEEWDVKELSKLCNISTGKKDVNEGNPNGVYPFFTCAREHTFSDSYSFDTEAILIAGNADVGHCKYYKGKFEAYQRTYILSSFKNADAKYLFLFLSHYFKNYVESLKQIGAMSYIKLPMLKEFLVKIPSLDEQKAIADLLTTADEEIQHLENKLTIFKNQKSYLLNNLITGAIRTPEKLSTAK